MTKVKTVRSSRTEASLYLGKAEQFLTEAQAAAVASRNDATMLNAIHAAVNAADAVAVALAGIRSADPDHQRAVDLLEEVAGDSPEIRHKAKQLRQLLAKKNAVEYESRRASAKEARDSLERASRVVDWAKVVIGRAGQ